jgi:putative addiction module killer protein
MNIIRTQEFVDNVKSIKDAKLSAIITSRLARVADGSFGDHHSVGGGVSELRIHYGAGYRIYYTMRGKEIVILLCAGIKSGQGKEQMKDIKKAQLMAQEV